MADPTFDIFGPPTKKDIRVGYISTERGYVENISVCEANTHAYKNPGATFIFKPKRDKIEFLTINEVNKLTPESIDKETCEAGGENSIRFVSSKDVPAKAVFMGGGGIGVAANPVIGQDGSVLAVHVVNQGLGYKYPPIVEIKDDLGIGVGAVTRAIMGEVAEQTIYYSDEEDYEVYDFCSDPYTSTPDKIDGGKESYYPNKTSRSEYGRRWSPEGKDVGKWIPQVYTTGKIPFSDIVDDYTKKVQIAGKDWWTTRKYPPLKVTSTGRTTKSFFKVDHPAWSEFMNNYAISPKPPSNVKPSDFAGIWYTFEWNVDFPYDGEYIFRGAKDNKSRFYLDNKPVGELGEFKGGVPSFKKTIKAGSQVLRLDLYNQPQMEKVTVQQPPPPSTSEIVFKITTGSMFANGVAIEELDINEVKPFTPPGMGKKGQLNVTHTRKIEYGRKYKVVFNSKGKGGGGQGDIKFVGLHSANTSIRVARKGKRIELKDGHGNDTNFALDIDVGKAKFSSDGRKILGSGNIKLTASWKDKTNVAGVSVDNVQIAGKIWTRTGTRGSQTHTITLDDGSAKPNIKLRTKGSNVIQMEDFTDNDWTDVVVSASSGQFTDLKGNIAYFSVPYPKKDIKKSTGSTGRQLREVFNTVDFISRANRQLWRTNVYGRGGFLNDYGVCPFDTKVLLKDNPYAGTHKIVWPNVNFPIDGNYTIEVAVDDNVDITIDDVKITKRGFSEGVSTGTLRVTRFIKQGSHNIVANLFQIAGGSFGFRKPDGKEVQVSDVKFKVTSAADFANKITIPGLFSVGKDYQGSQLNQTIIKQVESEKDYDVVLSSAQSTNVRLRVKDDGKRLEMEEWKDGDWQDLVCTIDRGEFYGVQGNRCKFRIDRTIKGINPMALAINIETEFTEKEIQAKRSWNENPMGVAMTIESPLPPIPQEPIPQQEGRCPNNPFWSTRFPGAKERWHPVKHNAWGKLMNRYAISPLPPSDEGDARNDSGSFTNTWTKTFPYGGYYKVVMAADNWGELWIDDEKVIDMGKDSGNSTFTNSVEKLIYISGPSSPDEPPISHDIKVVVENEKSLKTKRIDAKVFSTLDWLSGASSKKQNKEVNFKITSASLFGNGIKIPELGIDILKRYKGPQLNENFVRDIEINKIYEVELISFQSREGVRLRTSGESVLQMEDHTDSSWDDIQCSASAGRFFDFKPGANKATCKYVVTHATQASGSISSGTTKDGVTYQGPHLFHYQDKRWGKLLNQGSVSPIGSPTQSLSEPNDNILGTKILTWNNVDFPRTGEYQITFLADNNAKLFIDEQQVLITSGNHHLNELSPSSVKVSKGKHKIKIELTNINHKNRETADDNDRVFLSNPTGVVLKITTKQRIGTGEYKPWSVNPVGISAKLIPPPCPKKVKGKGVIPEVIVDDPGNGYNPNAGGGYPAALAIKKIRVKDPGINYNCVTDTIRLEPSNGSELKLVCGPFGRISEVQVINPGLGFNRTPQVIIESDGSPGSPTGVNLDIAIDFEVIVDPIVLDPDKLVQVTDLAGIKQTGYYQGRPYYGAVFYQDGVRYAGWYETAGELVQIYDTMQESIDAQVTTPASAILRQGSDVTSNDPRLNIPGTPENLT